MWIRILHQLLALCNLSMKQFSSGLSVLALGIFQCLWTMIYWSAPVLLSGLWQVIIFVKLVSASYFNLICVGYLFLFFVFFDSWFVPVVICFYFYFSRCRILNAISGPSTTCILHWGTICKRRLLPFFKLFANQRGQFCTFESNIVHAPLLLTRALTHLDAHTQMALG